MDYDFIRGILEPIQNQIFQIMEDKVNKEKAIDEIVKIIQDFQYNDELSEKYKWKRNLILFLLSTFFKY